MNRTCTVLLNPATGQVTESRTDAAGRYSAPNLPPGDYEVSAATDGLGAKTVRVTMGTAGQTLNLPLAPVAAKPGELSLGDLGFTPEQTMGSAAEQARLNRRSSMLKMHHHHDRSTDRDPDLFQRRRREA